MSQFTVEVFPDTSTIEVTTQVEYQIEVNNLAVPPIPVETITSISFDNNTLTYIDENGTSTNLDLSAYLDDTNLARIIEGSLDENGTATFTRDDGTFFTVDYSPFFDNTNLPRIDEANFNTSDGVLTLTRDNDTTITASFDGRYLQNITAENLENLGNVEDTPPGAAQDGFVLTWDNTTSEWKALEAGSPHSYISWSTSGSESQFRTSELFYDDDDSPNTIRTVSIVNDKLQIELATFSPTLSAAGQSRSWDQPATQFTVTVDNPSDITNQWISALALIDNATGVSTNVAGYSTSGPSPSPAAGVDWNQTFNPSGSATIYSNGTGLTGGAASARLTFADNFGTNYTETQPTISYSWSSANVTLSFSNLSGNNFLQFYSSVGYSVNVTGISDSNNYSHSISGVGGSLSNNAGSGSMTFTTGLHKNNNSGRSVSTVTTFSRPAGVTGTAYNVNDTASDSTISASFTYPSFYIWTVNTATSPTRPDIVTGYDFDTEVTELANQTKVLSTYINNTESTPRAFWFGVRSSVTQPSVFQTGSSPSLLSDVSVVTQTVALEPDSPLSGYVAENYTLYGITLQPGSTYVSIS